LGIITHDDVIDVLQEEATEDAQRLGAVNPLEQSYFQTSWPTLTWKRGLWLIILFLAALGTIFTLNAYASVLARPGLQWLVFFIPLVISSGGNCGSQSATLIVTALKTGDVTVQDWLRVVHRELLMGLCLGSFLGLLGFIAALVLSPDMHSALVIPITLVLIVTCGTLSGSLLPLLFRRLGLDPALMSTPFVAAIIDIVGILIYLNVALTILRE
jgi:magnesium transporter